MIYFNHTLSNLTSFKHISQHFFDLIFEKKRTSTTFFWYLFNLWKPIFWYLDSESDDFLLFDKKR